MRISHKERSLYYAIGLGFIAAVLGLIWPITNPLFINLAIIAQIYTKRGNKPSAGRAISFLAVVFAIISTASLIILPLFLLGEALRPTTEMIIVQIVTGAAAVVLYFLAYQKILKRTISWKGYLALTIIAGVYIITFMIHDTLSTLDADPVFDLIDIVAGISVTVTINLCERAAGSNLKPNESSTSPPQN